MSRRSCAMFLTCLLASPALFAEPGPCRYMVLTQVGFNVTSSAVTNDSRVECFNPYYNPYEGKFFANTWIVDESDNTIIGDDVCKDSRGRPGCVAMVWVGAAHGTPTAGHCYRSRIAASSTFESLESGSSLQCLGGSGACSCDLQDDAPGAGCPLILNLKPEPWHLTGLDDAVAFDIDGDGHLERMGWTQRQTSLAFLARDLNGNGLVDDGSELFGIGTRLIDGRRASNGFVALNEEDANLDGVIDPHDPAWQRLLLWTDDDHDGHSQPGELRALSKSGITALEVEHEEVGRRDVFGNLFRYQAKVRFGSERRPFYDVFFVMRP